MTTAYKSLDEDELMIVVNTQDIGRIEREWENRKPAKTFLSSVDFPDADEHNTIWLKELNRISMSTIHKLVMVIPPGSFPISAYIRFLKNRFFDKLFTRLVEIWVTDKGEIYSPEKHRETPCTFEKFTFTQALKADDIRIYNFPNSPGTITFKEVPIYVSSMTSKISIDHSNGSDLYLTMNETTSKFQILHLFGTGFRRIFLCGTTHHTFMKSLKNKDRFLIKMDDYYFESRDFSFVNLPNGNSTDNSYIELPKDLPAARGEMQPIVYIGNAPSISTNFFKFSCY